MLLQRNGQRCGVLGAARVFGMIAYARMPCRAACCRCQKRPIAATVCEAHMRRVFMTMIVWAASEQVALDENWMNCVFTHRSSHASLPNDERRFGAARVITDNADHEHPGVSPPGRLACWQAIIEADEKCGQADKYT